LVPVKVARPHGVTDIRISDEPVPVPVPGMSLVRVTAVGICGSDLHWYAEAGIGGVTLEQPLVMGHEFAGVIEGGPRHGERVAVDPEGAHLRAGAQDERDVPARHHTGRAGGRVDVAALVNERYPIEAAPEAFAAAASRRGLKIIVEPGRHLT
jgi:threonine dehydrogenase-like Zn-dependent dehydrogenase